MENERTEIDSIGEFGLIERIKNNFANSLQEYTVKGIGDDAAAFQPNKEDEIIVSSSDMLLEGIHFDLTYVPLKHLGYKAVVVNISDIAAMNGKAKQIMVNIGLSNRFSVEAVDEIYKGIQLACKYYNVDLVGGDTTSSPSGLVLSVSILGSVAKDKITYRDTAKPGDVICVSGDLGAAYLGLQVLKREKEVFMVNKDMLPQLDEKSYLVERQLKPEARVDIIEELDKAAVVPTSMIDISDGLASELLHICKMSDVGANIFEDKLPMDRMALETATDDLNISPLVCMLNGGEDYELLFTIAQDDFPKIENNLKIIPIGYIQDKSLGVKLISRANQSIDIQAQGWKHF